MGESEGWDKRSAPRRAFLGRDVLFCHYIRTFMPKYETTMNYLLLLSLYGLIPAGVIWLCRRFRWLGKLGPIMVLYAIGMAIGNLPFHPAEMGVLQELLHMTRRPVN